MKLSSVYWCIRKGFPMASLLTCDLPYYKLPKSTCIPHPFGITIADNSEIGEDVRVSPNVTIGAKKVEFRWPGWDAGIYIAPTIGNRVFIGAGAVILGDIVIADDCTIGAGSVVLDSFPEAGSIIAGNPARRIR